MASARTGPAVEIETRIAASPEAVFDFFTDPDKMIQWMGRSAEVLLESDGEGTNLRLIHSDLPSEEAAERHQHGWGHYTERLAVAASGGDPGVDPWANPEGPGATQ